MGSFAWLTFSFYNQKGGPTGAQRPSGHFFVVLNASKSHLINYSWVTTSKRCKIFHFFSFLLTFGGWDWNHFVQNFMENNSIKNFEAWKAEESAEKCLLRCTPMLSLIGLVTWLFWELEPKDDIWNRNWPGRNLRAYVQTTFDKSN